MKHKAQKLTVLTTALSLAISASYAAGGARVAGPQAAAAAAAIGAKTNVRAIEAANQAGPDQSGVQGQDQAQAQPQATTATTAAVSPCPPPARLPDGSYMGIQAGYDFYRVQHGIDLGANPAIFNSNFAMQPTGWAIGALLGYGKQFWQYFYLGGEIYINANTLNEQFSALTPIVTYNYNLDSGPTYGISLLPGIKLTPTTLSYLRLGYSRTLFKMQEDINGFGISSMNRLAGGFTFGVGMETLIIYTYSLRAEYQHAFYQSYNTNLPYNTRVTPSANQFMLSLIYHAV